MKRPALLPIAFGSALLCAGPAVAQFGGLPFDPPRPPGSVGRQQQQGYPPQQAYPPQPGYPQQQAYPPPPQQAYPPPSAARRPAVQTEDLPPPGSPQPAPPVPQRAGLPPIAAPAAAAPAPVPVPPPPVADAVTPPPPQRIANPTAMFSGLDKITGRITAFDAAIGETVQFGALQVTARACYSRPPTETPLTDGFVEVDEVTLQGDVRRIFTGWMFASSPGLHGVEHAVYDVWLVDCKGGAQAVAETQPTATSAAAPSRQPSQQQRQTGSQQRQRQQPPPGPVR
jgi:hypothetical protein